MQYRVVPVTPYQQNCSVIWCSETRRGAVIDPGGDIDKIEAVIREESIDIEKILLTHGHLDHVGGTAKMSQTYNAPIEGPHREEAFWLNALDAQAQMMGFEPVEAFQPTRWLDDGDEVSVGELKLQVFHCPGHTPGHVVFYHQNSSMVFVGDVLFNGSIGRTDFPRGDHQQLLDSIRTKLWPLGDEVTFVPGHGPQSTIGVERRHNPFVADHNFG
ncbi:MAG: hypothetical protein COA42_09815 [Alteromonadaceae bacterium]|nr:MAG: hypothetical protein COA42_09815 [Alteromonadaceae bacterium]